MTKQMTIVVIGALRVKGCLGHLNVKLKHNNLDGHSYETLHVIMVQITYITSKGSGEPVHLHSITRAFAVCTYS